MIEKDKTPYAERLERQDAVKFAIANFRLEGIEPTHSFLVDAERFIAGEIDLTGFVST